jgi:hypothetical protein
MEPLCPQPSQELQDAVAAAESDLERGLAQTEDIAPAGTAEGARAAVAADVVAVAAAGEAQRGSRVAQVQAMLHRLQELPWRRVDVSFQGSAFGFAHNNIQVCVGFSGSAFGFAHNNIQVCVGFSGSAFGFAHNNIQMWVGFSGSAFGFAHDNIQVCVGFRASSCPHPAFLHLDTYTDQIITVCGYTIATNLTFLACLVAASAQSCVAVGRLRISLCLVVCCICLTDLT